MKYTRKQKTAYHEAAHVVASLHYNIPFFDVHLEQDDETITTSDGSVHGEFHGVVEYDEGEAYARIGSRESDGFLAKTLAGLAAEKIMSPHRSYDWFINVGTARTDWDNALRFLIEHHQRSQEQAQALFAKFGQKLEVKEFSARAEDALLREHLRRVRSFVKAQWETIVIVGDALIASPKRRLSYQQCKRLLV